MGLYLNGKMVSPAIVNGSSSGVVSINGKSGHVTITAEDVGAATTDTVKDLQSTVAGKQDKGDYLTKVETTNVTDKAITNAKIATGAVTTDKLSDGAVTAEKLHKGDYIAQSELQDTVNTALAQAKASGEFDGATGDAGPQGPKGDTGPQGPAGADGTDASVTALNIKNALGYAPANPSNFLPLTGGTLAGDLVGKYITGTWLKTTSAGHLGSSSDKIVVLDSTGWLYYRTKSDLLSDLGATTQTWVTEQIQSAINATWEASY